MSEGRTTGEPAAHLAADLAADYVEHGFSVRLGAGERPAVLVVDVCRAYLEPASPLYAGVEQAVAAAGRVVAAGRAGGVPIVFTRVSYAPGLADAGLWVRKIPALKVLERGHPMGEFPAHPSPAEGELVIVKHYASAFFGTGLAEILHRQEIDTLVITGVSTSGCVRASVVDAVSHGFRPLVVREAVGDRDQRPHEAALFDIDAKYGDVISLTEALAVLGNARNPAPS